MQYLLNLAVTFTLQDDTETSENYANVMIDAETIPELREKFKEKLANECRKRNAKSFTGTILTTSRKRDWVQAFADEKNFSGTYSQTETLVIDINGS